MTTLIETYFDESESDGVLCVGGYLFEKEACVALDDKWKKVLEDHHLQHFHMVDCAHGAEEFKGRDVEERIEIQTKLIDLVKKYALVGYACTLELRFAHLIPSALAQGLEIVSPYSLLCYYCLMAGRRWAADNKFDGQIAYFFESGHASHSEANRIMNSIFSSRTLREMYKYASHTFGDKRILRPLQCADILAWQWRKYRKDFLRGNSKPRADLFSLLQLQHYVHHFDEPTLLAFREVVRKSNFETAMNAYRKRWAWIS